VGTGGVGALPVSNSCLYQNGCNQSIN